MYRDIDLNSISTIATDITKLIDSHIGNSYIVYMNGNMGSGKTTLAKHIGKALGVKVEMQSPTFTLMREYDISSYKEGKYSKLLHIDAYRFEDPVEGAILSLNKRAKENNVILIEWPDNMYAPPSDIQIDIERVADEDKRNIYVRKR
jgi:tRNA threonylcarbamoyladenosine biosynthesis protein TsaE